MKNSSDKPRILVTGAAGKTGASVVAQMLVREFPVRALVRRLDGRSEQLENRDGYQDGFLNLLRHEHQWKEARQNYAKITTPVLLVYGDKDWAPERERKRTQSLVPGATYAVVNQGGHFLSLDQPQELSRLISNFATAEASA